MRVYSYRESHSHQLATEREACKSNSQQACDHMKARLVVVQPHTWYLHEGDYEQVFRKAPRSSTSRQMHTRGADA